jgi:hypothetical protein
MHGRAYNAERTRGQQSRGKQGEISSRNTQHLIKYSPLLFAAPISSIHSIHCIKTSNSIQEELPIWTPIKPQISQCKIKI